MATTRPVTPHEAQEAPGVSPPRLDLARAIAATLALVAAAVLVPRVAEAAPWQEGSSEEQQAEVRERAGEVALEVDLLEAQAAEVADALATLDANVRLRERSLNEAKEAADVAAANLEAAEAAVAAAEVRVLELKRASDELAADSFMAPPAVNMIDSLRAGSINDTALMQALIGMQAQHDADVLDDLEKAEEDLQAERDTKATIAGEAEAARGAAQTAYDEVVAARNQQAEFAADAQDALDRRLTESANLATIDAELSRQIAAEQAELARRLEEAGAQPSDPPPVDGDVAVTTVNCSGGGTITVAQSIAGQVQSMLDAAAAGGVRLCGGGYRSSQAQIDLRRQNCGPSDWEIYEAPSSYCSPPTARPGTSEHEKGLAIDFENCSSHSTACWQWLDANAANYGMYNFPVEPWHWSTSGE